MVINFAKSRIIVNSIKPRPSTNTWMIGETLEEVDQFKWLESTQTKHVNKGSKIMIPVYAAKDHTIRNSGW